MWVDGDHFPKNLHVNMAHMNFRDISRTTPKREIFLGALSRHYGSESDSSPSSYSEDD